MEKSGASSDRESAANVVKEESGNMQICRTDEYAIYGALLEQFDLRIIRDAHIGGSHLEMQHF